MNNNPRYINPFTDFGFKKLFGTEFNKDLLIDFLNQVLDNREQIWDLTYLNTENQGKTEDDRKAILICTARMRRAKSSLLKCRMCIRNSLKDRSIYYATFPIQEQAIKGKDTEGLSWNYQLKAVYTVGILNFSFPDQPDQDRYVREVQLMDTLTHEIFYDKLSFIYLEMSRFNKTEDELETHFDKWLYVLKNLHWLEEIPEKLRDKIFVKLFNQAEIAKLTKKEMRAYEQSQKVYWDNYSVVETARKEGKKEGRNEGREEGRQKERVEIARELKKNGVSTALIAKSTGLDEKQIEGL